MRNWPDIIPGPLPGDSSVEDEDPTYEECQLAVDGIMGSNEDEDEQSSAVAVSGTGGMKIGILVQGVEDERWSAMRREEKCLRD